MLTLSLWSKSGQIFTKLTAGIYRTVAKVYNLMLSFAEGFSVDTILAENEKAGVLFSNIMSTIYILLGIFMLFRITISLIGYLVDPDKLSDKKVGGGSLIVRIFVSLLLIVSFGYICKITDRLQEALLEDGSFLFNWIVKDESGDEIDFTCIPDSSSRKAFRQSVKYCTLNATNYMSINLAYKKLCATTSDIKLYRNGVDFLKKDFSWFASNYEYSYVKKVNVYSAGRTIGTIFFPAWHTIGAIVTCDDWSLVIKEGKVYNLNGQRGINFAKTTVASFSSNPSQIIGSKFLENTAGDNEIAALVETDEGEFTLDNLTAIIVGIALLIFIIIICMEIVVRTLKLLLLRMVGIVAFVCYMNPNDKVLASWTKLYIGTYLDLFIKLFAVNLGISFISIISEEIMNENSVFSGSTFATLIFYLGIFLFIKVVPNFISKIFGIEDMGGTTKEAFGILKSGFKTAGKLGGAVAGGAAGLVGGLATGVGKGASFQSVAGGMLGGLGRGLKSGYKGDLLGGAKAQARINASNKQAKLAGANMWQRVTGKMGLQSTRGMDHKIEQQKDIAEKNKSAISYADNVKNYTLDQLMKGKAASFANAAPDNKAVIFRKEMDKLKSLDAVRGAIKRSDFKDTVTITEKDGKKITKITKTKEEKYQEAIKTANQEYEDQRSLIYDKNGNDPSLQDAAIAAYLELDKAASADKKDVGLEAILQSGKVSLEASGMQFEKAEDYYNYSSIKAAKDKAEIEASIAEAQAKAIETSAKYKAKKAAENLNK